MKDAPININKYLSENEIDAINSSYQRTISNLPEDERQEALTRQNDLTERMYRDKVIEKFQEESNIENISDARVLVVSVARVMLINNLLSEESDEDLIGGLNKLKSEVVAQALSPSDKITIENKLSMYKNAVTFLGDASKQELNVITKQK